MAEFVREMTREELIAVNNELKEQIKKLEFRLAEAHTAVDEAIIRCKDCDWWEKQKDSVQGRCELMQMYPAGGWFCGNARRRESNEA